ncbi:MAG TPA: efflux transporter outer membrane subunit [Rhizomicrobium sp.]|jgi:NodT family efflux transporter outer membrane factor (OMF) lipoprotein|nr:efflux transporter outer membrane subunit [Rhizomicrobium sp.]
MNAFVRFAAVAVVACAAAACSTPVPQALKPPDVPPAFVGPLTPGAPIWPNPDWWNNFGSIELSGLVTTAQTDNLDIAVAMANVLQAEANRDIAGAALFPTFDLQGTASRSRTPGSSFTTVGPNGQPITAGGAFTGNQFGLLLNGTYYADIWGLARDNLRAAQEALKSSQFAQQEVALTTTASVADTYLLVLALRQEIATIEQNIDAAKRILTITRAKVTNGVSSQLDLSQQEATVYGQEAALPPLREQEREAVFSLAILLGRPPEGFTVTAQNMDALKAPPVNPGLPSELLERRPDVAQAEANLASAHANVDAARAAFFPQINLTGDGGFASAAIGTLFRASSLEWSVGASALQTVFDGGKLIGQSDLAKAQQQGLIATYRKTVFTAFEGVENSLGQVGNFSEEENALQQEVTASANAFRISELQYREGIADLLSVLQAQQTLFTAENLLIQVKLSRLQASVGLYLALGGGWAENPEDKTQTVPQPAIPIEPASAPAAQPSSAPAPPPTTAPTSASPAAPPPAVTPSPSPPTVTPSPSPPAKT